MEDFGTDRDNSSFSRFPIIDLNFSVLALKTVQGFGELDSLLWGFDFFLSSVSFSGDTARSVPAWLSPPSSPSSSSLSASLSGAPKGFAGFALESGLLPGAAKLPNGLAPERDDPKPLPLPPLPLPPPKALAKPLELESPAKGEAPLPPLKDNFGAEADCEFAEDCGEAKEDSFGALAKPDPPPLGPPKVAKGEEEDASLPKPDASKALAEVRGTFCSVVLESSLAVCFSALLSSSSFP